MTMQWKYRPDEAAFESMSEHSAAVAKADARKGVDADDHPSEEPRAACHIRQQWESKKEKMRTKNADGR